MIQETFSINDITLRINPTDIQIFNQKLVDSQTFIRENSTYSYTSNSAVAIYSTTIAFDMTNEEDVRNLVLLSTELTKYPYVWIKSKRLSQFIAPIGLQNNEFAAFAIKEWQLRIDSTIKKVVFLSMDMYQFSHVPYIKSWSFLAYDRIPKPEGSSSGRVESSANENTAIDLEEFKVYRVNDLKESNVFSDYFKADNESNSDKFNKIMAKLGTTGFTIGRPLLMNATPQFDNKPKEIIDSNIHNVGFDDEDFKPITFINTYFDKENAAESEQSNYWLAYQDIDIMNILDPDTQECPYVVKSLTIVKRNNIVAQALQKYEFPFIQYLGKSPSEMNIEISINNSNANYREGAIRPFELITTAIKEAERVRYVANNKLVPLKSLRIRSPLNVLAGSHYFIVNSETSFESGEDQGHQVMSLSFVESDLTKLIGKDQLKPGGVKSYDIDVLPLVRMMRLVTKEYIDGDVDGVSIDLKGSNKVVTGNRDVYEKLKGTSNDTYLKKIEAKEAEAAAAIERLNTGQSLTDNTYLNAVKQDAVDIWKEFLANDKTVEGILYRSYVAAEVYADTLLGKDTSKIEKSYGSSMRKAIVSYDLIEQKILAGKVDISEKRFQDFRYTLNKSAEQLMFISLNSKNKQQLKYADAGIKVLASMFESVINTEVKEIDDEAMSDLNIFKSLLAARNETNSVNKKSYLGEGDGKRFSPFFFIYQDVYADAISLSTVFQYIDTKTGEALKAAIRTPDADYTEMVGMSIKRLGEETTPDATIRIAGQDIVLPKKVALAGKQQAVADEIRAHVAAYNAKFRKTNDIQFSPDTMVAIAKIESGFDKNIINPVNKKYKGLFQVDNAKLIRAGYKPEDYNRVDANTYAALKDLYDYTAPALKRHSLQPSAFNIYMMHQQGAAGWPYILKAANDPALADTIPKGTVYIDGAPVSLRSHIASNNPIKKKTDMTYRDFVNAWKAAWVKRTGTQAYVTDLGRVEDHQTKYPSVVKGNTKPADTKLFATIYNNKVNIFDGDTVSITKQSGSINSSIRLFAINAPETEHRVDATSIFASPGQKGGKEAHARLQSLFRNAKYPISVYKPEKSADANAGGRDVAILIDADGVDFNLEMIRGGYVKVEGGFEKAVPDRVGLYTAANNIAQKENLQLYNNIVAPDDPLNNNKNPAITNIPELPVGFGVSDIPTQTSGIGMSDVVNDADKLGESKNDVRKPSGLLTKARSLKFEGMKTTGIDQFGEADQAAYRSLRTGNYLSTGLSRSIPVVKVYLVEGLRDDWQSRLAIIPPRDTNLYEVFGVSDVRIQTADEDNPVAVMALNIANPGSIYSDLAAGQVNISGTFDYSKLNTDFDYRDRIGKLRITTGTRLHVRIGYSNDPNELETVFNGEITEVEGESILSVVAEGYGRELIMLTHGLNKVESASGGVNASTSGVINEVLRSKEIYHFGQTYYMVNHQNMYARSILRGNKSDASDNTRTILNSEKVGTSSASGDFILGVWWDNNSEVFTNVYSPVIEDNDKLFTLTNNFLARMVRGLFSFDSFVLAHFPIFNTTVWEVLKEMQYRHPGTWSSVFNYKERATFFFGIKEQLYIYRDAPISTFKGNLPTTFNIVDEAVDKIKWKDLKPAAEFHIITSEQDIVSNLIQLNASFKTKINVRYFNDNQSTDEMAQEDGYEYYSMQMDDNLKPFAVRSMQLDMNGADHKIAAYRYGTSELKHQAEQMYSGKIVLIGNQNMKAGDYAYINDTTRGLNGVIKIRECSHIINENDGYLTVITPGLYVEASQYIYSTLFTKLAMSAAIITNKIVLETQSNLFAYNRTNTVSSMLGLFASRQMAEINDENKRFTAAYFTARFVQGAPTVAIGALSAASFTALYRGLFFYDTAAYLASGFSSSVVLEAGKAAISLANSATRSVVAGLYDSILVWGASQSGGFFGSVARTATNVLLRTGMSFLTLATLPGAPLAIGAGIIMLAAYAKIEEIEQTREPIRIFPLLWNGSPYIAGIAGFEMNTYFQSFKTNAKSNFEAASLVLDKVSNIADTEIDRNIIDTLNAINATSTVNITTISTSGVKVQ